MSMHESDWKRKRIEVVVHSPTTSCRLSLGLRAVQRCVTLSRKNLEGSRMRAHSSHFSSRMSPSELILIAATNVPLVDQFFFENDTGNQEQEDSPTLTFIRSIIPAIGLSFEAAVSFLSNCKRKAWAQIGRRVFRRRSRSSETSLATLQSVRTSPFEVCAALDVELYCVKPRFPSVGALRLGWGKIQGM